MIYLDDLDGMLFEHGDVIHLIETTDDNRVLFIDMATGKDVSTIELLHAALGHIKHTVDLGVSN